MAQNSGIAPPISANGFSTNEPTRENPDGMSGRIRTVALAFIRLTNPAREPSELDRYQSSAETLEVAFEKGKISGQYSRIVKSWGKEEKAVKVTQANRGQTARAPEYV